MIYVLFAGAEPAAGGWRDMQAIIPDISQETCSANLTKGWLWYHVVGFDISSQTAAVVAEGAWLMGRWNHGPR